MACFIFYFCELNCTLSFFLREKDMNDYLKVVLGSFTILEKHIAPSFGFKQES